MAGSIDLSGGRVATRSVPGGGLAAMLFGDGPPSTSLHARPRVCYWDQLTDDIYQMGANMQWSLLGNIKGDPGDAVLSEEQRLQLLADAEDATLAELEPPIDLVVLFENALQE